MATYYSQGSGRWSTLANWDTLSGGGGSDPASVAAMEDNLFVIQAGHVIDYDLTATSTWTTGFQTITIYGHATTPGVLRCDSTTLSADTYVLPMKTGFSIAGSTAAVTEHGRILANSDGNWTTTTPLANDRKFIICTLTGSSTVTMIDAPHLNIRLFCTQPPTNNYVEIYGTPYVVTMEADDDKVTFVSPSTTPPQAGTPVTFSGTLPAELVVGTTYFIRDVSGATCKLEATIGGGAINLTDDGSGTIYCHYGCWGPVAQATNVNISTGVITWNGVPPAANTPVRVKSSGTLPTGLTAYDLYYVRTISGNTCKLSLTATDTDIVIPSATGTGNISMYEGSSYTTSKVVNVIQDVTTEWVATAGGNGANVVLVDWGPADYDQQRDVIATFNARYLILTTNNIDSAQYPLARIYLVARNVALRSASTGAQAIVSTATGGIFQCEIRNSSGTGTTFVGTGITASPNNTVSGVISGMNYGVANSCNNNTISGIICCCSAAFGNSSSNNTVSGVICACINAFGSSSNNNTVSGLLIGNTYCFVSFRNVSSGIICGCNYVLSNCTSNTFLGEIRACGYVGSSSGCGMATLINVFISPSLTVSSRNLINYSLRLTCENLYGVEGSMKIYEQYGDIVKVACDGTGDYPSVDPDGGHGNCLEVSNVQSNLGIPTGSIYPNKLLIFDKHRIWMTAASHTVTYKVQTTYAEITAGNLILTARYITTDGALTEITNAPAIATRSDDTDWTQTLAVTFNPARDGWVDFKMELMEYESGNEVYVWPTPVIT